MTRRNTYMLHLSEDEDAGLAELAKHLDARRSEVVRALVAQALSDSASYTELRKRIEAARVKVKPG